MMRKYREAKPAVQAAPAAAAAPVEAATAPRAADEWRLDAAAIERFSQMFADACTAAGEGVDKLGKAEAGPVLSMSGLPIEILLQIWALADVDGDDMLNAREYLLCCFLVQRCVQKQEAPPPSLPPPLLASVTAALAPLQPQSSTSGGAGSSSASSGKYAEQMQQLVDMGLEDLAANERELERNNGDLNATITALLGPGAGR